jgi:hypothetical protein
MVFFRSIAVDLHTKPDRPSFLGRAEHQVDIARMETENDPSENGIERRHLRLIGPVARKPPLVELRMPRDRVRMGGVFHEAARREEAVSAIAADIRFGLTHEGELDKHDRIVEGGFDLAIHSGDLPDSTLVAPKIRADDDHSRRHSSVPLTARRARIAAPHSEEQLFKHFGVSHAMTAEITSFTNFRELQRTQTCSQALH